MLIMCKRQCLLGLLLAHQSHAFTGRTQIHRRDALRSLSPTGSNSNNAFLRSRMSATANPPSTNTNANTSSNQESKSLDNKNRKEIEVHKKPHKQTKLENRRGKRRTNNQAMGDTAFLRKRTTELLRVTSKEHLAFLNTVSLSDTTNTTADGVVVVEANVNAMDVPLSGGMKVGRKTFNFLIDAWAFSGEMDAGDQTLELLARMEELSDYARISPDVRSYTKVINAVSRSMRADAGEIAENLLDKMEQLSSSGANPSAKPNTFTYTAVIEAYAHSGAQGSAMKAEEVCECLTEVAHDVGGATSSHKRAPDINDNYLLC